MANGLTHSPSACYEHLGPPATYLGDEDGIPGPALAVESFAAHEQKLSLSL